MSIFTGNKQRASLRNCLRGFSLALALMLATHAYGVEQVVYYHFDALGSPVAASDATGDYYLWKETYQPYGDRIQKQPNSANNTRWYTGHPHEETTGLTYMGARWYDPVVGRFMGVDPQEFTEANPHSFNRYSYANNSPYKYIDPDGEVPILIPIIVPAVIGIGTFAYELYNPPAINPAHPDAIYPSMGPGEVLGGPLGSAGRAGLVAIKAAMGKGGGDLVVNIGEKITRQIEKRGWTQGDILKTIQNPTRTTSVRDTRHLPDGSRLNDPATAYIGPDGRYVIRNDKTGDIVQISNRNDPNWRAPWDQ